jgi:radical SAM protein with 4Fe4S-binding SPASM domain
MADLAAIYDRVKAVYGRVAKGVHPWATLPPLRVTFEVTYRCNLSCPFCFQEHAREESGEFGKDTELRNDEILAVVASLPPYTLVTFNGGEVFVRRDFPELLRAVSRMGRRFNLVTNGTMLTADQAQLLVDETKTLSVGVSIDGIGATHDAIRRLPGAFARTVANLRGLAEYRQQQGRSLPAIDLKTVMTRENLGQLKDIYLLAREIGADYTTYSCLRTSELLFALPCRASMDDGAYLDAPAPLATPIPLEELGAQLREIAELARQGKPRLRFYPDYPEIPGILRYYADQEELDDYELCRAPWTNIRIAPNGDVYPCLAYRMGNVREGRLPHIWKGENMNRFRAALERELVPACLGCCFLNAKKGLTSALPVPAQAARVAQAVGPRLGG